MKPFNLENNQKITTGFTIPENYFETFETKILSQINDNPVKIISIYQKKSFWIGVAALIIISISSITYFSNYQNTSANNIDYLTYQTNLTTEDIVEQLTDDDIEKIEASLNLYDSETINYAKEYLQ